LSSVEDSVCEKILGRAEVGLAKYGVTMDTAPLTTLDWLVHAQEEAMDLSVYLQKLIQKHKVEVKIMSKYTVEIITAAGGTFINTNEIAALVRYEGHIDIHLKSGTIFTANLLANEEFDHDNLLSDLMNEER
jgi:hypothetical protein